MIPPPELVERFRADCDPLVAEGSRLGLAVSGGPDSLALLLLAAAACPGLVEAATVDHNLRPESRVEAEAVALLCQRLGVPHAILMIEWTEKPVTAVQERARAGRYGLLADWVRAAGLDALLTAHQAEDQAETFLMRLARGAGVKGLSAMRKVARVPGGDVPLVRPLLRWRRAELEAICAVAGVDPARDPGNDDERFERIRVRRALGQAPWLDPDAIVSSAAHLQAADAALHWATTQVWSTAVTVDDGSILFRPDGIPREIKRRVAARAIAALASEGEGSDLRGGELDRLLAALRSGRPATLRGVLCSGGEEWRFVPAPNRTRRASNPR